MNPRFKSLQEETDASRKRATSTQSQRTTGRCAPGAGFAILDEERKAKAKSKARSKKESPSALRRRPSVAERQQGVEGCGREKEIHVCI
jgi:hypothetical protein